MGKKPFSSKHMLTLLVVFVLFPLVVTLCGGWQYLRIWENPFFTPYRLWQKWATMASMGLGLAGALVGGLGLLSICWASNRALQSRAALLHNFAQGLSRLPNLLLGMGLSTALGLACIIGYEVITYGLVTPIIGRTRLIVYGCVAIAALLWYSLSLCATMRKASQAMLRPAPPIFLLGKSFAEAEFPLLWAFVRQVAAKAETVLPDTIVLGMSEGFFVTEQAVELAHEEMHTGRTLYLSLPYLMYMSRGEAAAVIGHELAHFTGEDTEYSLRFSPIYARAVNNISAASAPCEAGNSWLTRLAFLASRLLGEFYLSAFDAAVNHWSRERELAADQRGALAGGAENVALSLLRISALAPHVEQALGECWRKGGDVEGGVLHRMQELVREQGLDDPAAYLHNCQPHPTDSHPTTSQRLQAMGIEPSAALLAQAREGSESPLLHELGIRDGEFCATAPANAAFSIGVETEFARAAEVNRGNMREELEEMEQLGTDRIVVYEKYVFTLVRGIALLGLTGAMALLGQGVGMKIVGAVFACIFLWAVTDAWSNRHKPLLTLTPTGFQVADMQASAENEIPWLHVENVWAKTIMGTTILSITLEQGLPAPVFRADKRVTWNKKSWGIVIRVTGVRAPWSVNSLQESIIAHWQGAMARQGLRDLE